jgi:hypothetical protein
VRDPISLANLVVVFFLTVPIGVLYIAATILGAVTAVYAGIRRMLLRIVMRATRGSRNTRTTSVSGLKKPSEKGFSKCSESAEIVNISSARMRKELSRHTTKGSMSAYRHYVPKGNKDISPS